MEGDIVIAALLGTTALLMAVSAGFYLAGRRANRYRELAPVPPHLLVVAAHPDDCVICCGELGQEVARAGGMVRIVYVTAGSSNPGDERARIREAESVAAWEILGVPAEALVFLGLPESSTKGPLSADERTVEAARGRLAAEIAHMPAGFALVIPDAAESHIDHLLTRTITLDALDQTGRTGVQVLECAEYNMLHSLKYSPHKTLARMFASLPLVSRLVRRSHADPGGLHGGGGRCLPPDRQRLDRKIQALRSFGSQNAGDQLVVSFGRPDCLRPVAPDTAARGLQLHAPGSIALRGTYADPSALSLWATLTCASATLGAAITHRCGVVAGTAALTLVAFGFLVMGLRSLRRDNTPERTAFDLGLVVGAAIGVVTHVLPFVRGL